MALSFRKWIENMQDPFAISNPKKMAKHWSDNLPEDDSQMMNKAGVMEFADAMYKASSGEEGGQNLAHHVSGYDTPVLAYDKPIANNLLNANDERLREARGFISNEEPEFGFMMYGDRAGSLFIQHQPAVYDEEDKVLIQKVIEHELGHAIDWLNPKFQHVPPSGRYIFNAEAYAENIHEARRLSGMLVSLLKEVGSASKVIDMLQKPGPFTLAPALAPVAASFLITFAKEHGMKMEWQSWLAPLVASMGASWADPQVQTAAQKPAYVYDQRAEAAKSAANITKRIVKMMQLRNFVTYKGK